MFAGKNLLHFTRFLCECILHSSTFLHVSNIYYIFEQIKTWNPDHGDLHVLFMHKLLIWVQQHSFPIWCLPKGCIALATHTWAATISCPTIFIHHMDIVLVSLKMAARKIGAFTWSTELQFTNRLVACLNFFWRVWFFVNLFPLSSTNILILYWLYELST